MSWRTLLKDYALLSDPTKLPASIRFSHNESNLTIFDCYPKAIFHFLVLSRPSKVISANRLADLRTLLRGDKQQAKDTLFGLKHTADDIKVQIEKEMLTRYGFKWPIWTGFHAVPSMLHIHLHIISSDLHSPSLKNKKHYNSFHPKLGFFLHLDEVLDWFEATDSHWEKTSQLKIGDYEPLLKEALQCWRCDEVLKTIPALKEHLKEHFETDVAKAKKKQERREAGKRKRDEQEGPDAGPDAQKRKEA